MSYTPQGLVTVAFLKAQLDAGKDHLSLFEPLVLDALNQISTDDLIAQDVQKLISERTNLAVPAATVQTLLARCSRKGYLRRSGDRFHKTQMAIPASTLTAASAQIKVDQLLLGEALIEHSSAVDITFESAESAIQALASFISAHKLELLLQGSSIDPKQGGRKDARNLARFITERCIPEPNLSRSLTSLLEGILIADVLLMKDIRNTEQNFAHCVVYLDTPILLAVLGLNGTANEIAAKEGLAAIRRAGAQTAAFERTVVELRGILRIYEEKLGTNEGRLNLFPNSMTSYMIANRFTPADVKVIALEVERNLQGMAINTYEYPKHEAIYTLGEEALARALSPVQTSEEESKPRVRHDVDCVAAILTLRAGHAALDIEHSRAVFSTTSGLVVKNVNQWYADQKGDGLSPVVHHAFLTTLAWLKKPASSPHLKLHELAAVCLSTMRPTVAIWDKTLATLRQYVAEGRMSDDESVAIVANGLTETLLSALDDDFDPDSGSINDAIERVREELRREHLAAAETKIAHIRSSSQTLLDAAHAREESAKLEALLSQQAASDAQVLANEQRNTTIEGIDRIARIVGNAVYFLIVAGLAIAAICAGIGIEHSKHPILKWAIPAALISSSLISFFGSVWGTSAKSAGEKIQSIIVRHLRRRLI